MERNKLSLVLIVLLIGLSTLFCSVGGGNQTDTQEPQEAATEPPAVATSEVPESIPASNTPPPEATATPEPTETTDTELVEHQQWASQATASTEYGSDYWSAAQAIGEPDTQVCEDSITAWASDAWDGIDWLEVHFATPVYAYAVNIHEVYNPDQVVSVELLDASDNAYEIYSAEPIVYDICPMVLELSFEMTEFLVNGVRIHLDQSVTEMGWNEIDAVEIIGMVDPATIVETPPEVTPTEVVYDIPANYLWSIEAGEIAGGALAGMDTDANDLLYMADNFNGVRVINTQGVLVNTINHDEMNNPSDVKIGPDGNVYVASWGSNEIYIFTPGGQLITRFGEAGTGDGQFGWASPDALAVSPDGTIYALDSNEDANGASYDRIQMFDSTGNYLGQFKIEDQYFAASGMDFGPDGILYVVGFLGDYIIKYDTAGNILGKIGDVALDYSGPQSIALDDAGNIFVTVWTDAGILKLDPNGMLVETFGFAVEIGSPGWPEGAFYQPSGVAVLRDGSMVFSTDYNGNDYFLLAFSAE